MAINRTPVLKRCRQLGLDPSVLGYSSKKESIRQPKRRRKESEYGMQLREKQKAKFSITTDFLPRFHMHIK